MKAKLETVEEDIIALIYKRVSSNRQKNEGHGLESQEHRCREYAKTRGWKVIEEGIFSDDYTGGGDFMNRPAMRSLLAYVDANPHKKFVIVFDDLKRFARDTVFHLELRRALKARDVEPYCLNFKFDETPEGRFVETILAAGNELERQQNKRQVIQKQRAILEIGGMPFGGRKIGYKSVVDTVTKRKVRVPDEYAKIVKEGLEGFAYKRFQNRIALARFWKEKGVFKKQTPEQSLGSVNNMLRDVFYAGYVEYLPWEVSRREGWQKPLITLEVFDLNQKRLNAETEGKRVRLENNPDFELCGLVACPECKSSLRAYWAKGRKSRYAYYECKNKACSMRGKTIRRDDIEGDFRKLIKKYKPKTGLSEVATAMFEDVWSECSKEAVGKVSSIQKLLKDIESDIASLGDKLAKAPVGSVLEEELSRRIEEKGKIRKETEAKIAERRDPSISYRTAGEKVFSAIESPLKLWTSATIEQKKQLFFFFFDERLEYEKKKSYRTAQMSPILRLFEQSDSSSSDYVDIAKNEWNQIESYIFESYYMIQGLKMREIATVC